jgi:CRISPR/Cas system-associated exonuclease Cas4 (RecB family)
MKPIVSQKIKSLFNEIPQLEEWFSGNYEVLNEREIIAKGQVHIPDRVMIKNNDATIIDYKRDKQDPKHHHQIKEYAELLEKMGYQDIRMYLIYTNDHLLVEVK